MKVNILGLFKLDIFKSPSFFPKDREVKLKILNLGFTKNL